MGIVVKKQALVV